MCVCVCAGTLAVYLRRAVRKCPARSPVPARVRRSILRQRRQKRRRGWPLTERSNSSRTARTLASAHCNFCRNELLGGDNDNKISQRLVSAGPERRSFTGVRTRGPALCTPQKGNYLQLMPTHQLYRSAHSCHLDRFLLRSSLASAQRAAGRPGAAPPSGYRQGGGGFLKAPRLLPEAGIVEKCAKARIRDPFRLRA